MIRTHVIGLLKYKVFRVSMLDRWVVVVSGADMNEELRKVPNTHVSFVEAVDDESELPCIFTHATLSTLLLTWFNSSLI